MPQRRDIGRPVERRPWQQAGQVARRHPGICTSHQIAQKVFCTVGARPADPTSPQPRDVPPCITLARHYVFYMQQE